MVPRTVLLVEDDDAFATPLARALGERGHRVLSARTGARATALAEHDTIDLVVVDGLLPDVDGVSWIGTFRKRHPRTPVAFVSAFSGFVEALQRAAAPLDIALVVHKPVDVSVLCGKLGDCLVGTAVRADCPAPTSAVGASAPSAFRAEYVRTLPGKLQQLAVALRAARSHPGDLLQVREARTLAHRLRGSAGLHGFTRVGEHAGRIDDALTEAVSGRPVVDATWNEIDVELDRAGALADAAIQEIVRRRAQPLGVGSARLLVLSSDSLFRASVEEVGHTHLIEVAHASSPTQAVTGALSRPPDAVLVDLAATSTQVSFAAVQRLRSLSAPGSLPVAFVASAPSAEMRLAAARSGGELFLTKPIGAEALGLAVRQLLGAHQAPPARVLVLSGGEPWARELCVTLARSGLVVTPWLDPSRVLSALDAQRPDLLVLDQELSEPSGVDLCRIVRTSAEWQDLPIVVMTRSSDPTARMAAFEVGADDHVVLPVGDDELVARLRVRLERARISRDRHEKDALTGLAVRRTFLELSTRALAWGRRQDRPVAVCLLDLDFFKSINDGHGHRGGDRVLAALGRLLTSRFRAEDVCGRWGGEEFALAFPGETAPVMASVMEGVLSDFASQSFQGDGGDTFRATFSAGIASAPDDGPSLETLLEAADRRLYAAKHGGRARVVASG